VSPPNPTEKGGKTRACLGLIYRGGHSFSFLEVSLFYRVELWGGKEELVRKAAGSQHILPDPERRDVGGSDDGRKVRSERLPTDEMSPKKKQEKGVGALRINLQEYRGRGNISV